MIDECQERAFHGIAYKCTSFPGEITFVKPNSLENCPSLQVYIASVAIMVLKPKVYQFLVGVFASMGSILFGYDLGVIASVIAASNFKEYFNNPSTTQT